MNTNKSAAIAAIAAAFVLLLSGTSSADDSCVWSNELQRWICVPP